ncbi:sugar ABC transporter ATP-binding protein [soil metagenome]
MAEPASSRLLSLEGIHKHFGGVVAVDGVDFDLGPGEVHALVGENGAGKSTLMKVAVGFHQPDEGRVEVDGEPVAFRSTRDAEAAGIAIIPQELDQFPHLSVAENLAVGRARPRRRWGGIDWDALAETARRQLGELGLDLDVTAPLGLLSAANRQVVAIARALAGDARVVVMDEPTAALSERETERLFAIITDLSSRGVGVVYISHRLEEVFRIADRITVLRDGHHVRTATTSELDTDELVRLMVGRPLGEQVPRSDRSVGDTALELRGLTRAGAFADIDLVLRRGEVLGLAGLIGAGRTEVAQAMFGVAPADSGDILLDGEAVSIRSPEEAMRRGIAYVPEERRSQGLVLPFSIRANISLSSLERLSRGGLINRRAERELAERSATALAIRGAELGAPAAHLSGGNQQKVVLSKALAREPGILLFDEPTRGVDVGAKAEIARLIDRLAADGNAVLVISSELEEVLALADRVAVMREGRVVGELAGTEATQERVMALATGSAKPDDEAAPAQAQP